MKIVSIVGTRPNFMKVAPLADEFRKHKNIKNIIVHTGQHYDRYMSRLFFEELGMPKPDEHLSMRPNINGEDQKKFLNNAIKGVLEKHKPELVVVVGDVNSTVAGAEAAHELGIKIVHVEAGLRSFDNSMPEEINRIKTDKISDLLFTTEKSGNENLLKEGISKNKIFFVGNVMIDTLLKHKEKSRQSKILEELKLERKEYCVLTLHRPSNVDSRDSLNYMLDILDAIEKNIKIVFPVHPRTMKNLESFGLLKYAKGLKNLIMTNPLGYLDFIKLMADSSFVLTDSGGIQEETTVLGVPCITIRNSTERPITVDEGTNVLVSTDKSRIIKSILKLLNESKFKAKMPYLWDGKASARIVDVILKEFN
jgi:UDP-N-acetylglucosamine 2-epimerase (non-hydrolysing)